VIAKESRTKFGEMPTTGDRTRAQPRGRRVYEALVLAKHLS
jgi:hypothetical protein